MTQIVPQANESTESINPDEHLPSFIPGLLLGGITTVVLTVFLTAFGGAVTPVTGGLLMGSFTLLFSFVHLHHVYFAGGP